MVIVDQFNVRTLYPEKPGGEQRYIRGDGSNLIPFGATGQTTITPNDDSQIGRYFTFEAGAVDAVFFTSAGYRQSNIILDHSELDLNTGGRGYMMDSRDWRDVEFTTYAKVSSSENNSIKLSVRGGQRNSGRPCEAASYKAAVHYTNGNVIVAKERYYTGISGMAPVTTGAGPLDHWVGIKLVTVNRVVNGKHCVLIEVWIDANATNSWLKRVSMLDDGDDICVTGNDCSGSGTCQIINWGGPYATFEIPTTGVSIAKCSIREINYDGSFGSTPPPPPPAGTPSTPPATPPANNPSGKFNVPGGNIVASGNDGNVPANTYDNNLNTRWSNSPNPQWISYDLGAIRRVSNVGVHWYRPLIPDPPSPTPSPPPPGSPPTTPPPPPGSLEEGGVRMFYPKKGTTETFVFSSSIEGRAQYVATLPHCFVNLEVTAYLNLLSGVSDNGEEVSIKVRGGCHGCNDDDCGKCYIMGVGYDGTINAQWEEPHPSNHAYSIHENAGNFRPWTNIENQGWFGIKAICYLQGNHDHLEIWLDTDGLNAFGQPMNSWRKFWELNVDDYTGICPAPSGCDRRFLTFFRMDEVEGNEEDAFDFRFATCREIIV